MRTINRLDAKTVRAFLANPDAGKIADGANLYLQDTGSWIFRYRQRGTGRVREIGLGSSIIVPLESARAKARALNEGLWRGEDPKAARVEKRKTEAKQMTFGEFIESSRDALTGGRFKNEKTRKEWDSRLERFAKPLHLVLLSEVGSDDVKACLDPIWITKNNTAKAVAFDIAEIMKTARALKLCEFDANPAEVARDAMPKLAKSKRAKVQHREAIPLAGLQAFMAKIRGVDAIKARLVEFQALTATRPSEARLALWSEINLVDRTWVIPAERFEGAASPGGMKAGEEHRVALCPRAVEILSELQKTAHNSGFVFVNPATGEPYSEKTALRLIQAYYPTATAHGFRSCFADWVADHTDIPEKARKAALAHAAGKTDKVDAAYRRGDGLEARREAMNLWCKWLAGK